MKKIDGFTGVADKLQSSGQLDYYLWVNDKGELYVEIKNSDEKGTVSSCVFSVAEYAIESKNKPKINNLIGVNPYTDELVPSSNFNDCGFLKAVLCDLLPQ